MEVNQDSHSGGRAQIRTCSPMQTPAHGSAACGMFWIARSTMALAERTNWTALPTPCVIFDSVEFFLSWCRNVLLVRVLRFPAQETGPLLECEFQECLQFDALLSTYPWPP